MIGGAAGEQPPGELLTLSSTIAGVIHGREGSS